MKLRSTDKDRHIHKVASNRPAGSIQNQTIWWVKAKKSKSPNNRIIDKLLYQRSNTYRLHLDNLRWTLLGGFIAFLVVAFNILGKSENGLGPSLPTIYLFLWLITLAYFIILSVQNWYYNLYSEYVDDCESKLIQSKRLAGYLEFARNNREKIKPYHPAYSFAVFIVGIISFVFIYLFLKSSYLNGITPFFQNLPQFLNMLFWVFGFLLYFSGIVSIHRNWNQFYSFILKYFSPKTDGR